MIKLSLKDAIGKPLAHDVTQIIPGVSKGSRFKKGHIIIEEDIDVLLSMGKQNVYVLDLKKGDIHEEEAALSIAKAVAGDNVIYELKGEGKVEFIAALRGILKINEAFLMEFLEDDEIMFASLHQNQVVEEGQIIAGTRVIPLYVNEAVVRRAEQFKELISINSMKECKVGIVTTGSEIYHNRIKDAFGDILRKKFQNYGSIVIRQLFSDDDIDMISGCIGQLIEEGADFIAVTGGMSVDPDDVTPAGIKASGADIISYGAPVLPGAMFLLAYLGNIPIVGLPGCVMYHGISIFDLIIPRLLSGERLAKKDIKVLSQGGLCRGCEACSYPNCGFGKA